MAEHEQRDTEGEAQVLRWAQEMDRRYKINVSLWLLLFPVFSFLLEWLFSQMSHGVVLSFVPTMIAGAISGLMIIACWLINWNSPEFRLHKDRLHIPHNPFTRRLYPAVYLDEIVAIVETNGGLRRRDRTLVIIDKQGKPYRINEAVFAAPSGYDELKEALDAHLLEAGILEQVRERSRGEQEKERFYRRGWAPPVTFGFAFALSAIFAATHGRAGDTHIPYDELNELYLLDIGGVWSPAVLEGQWARILIAPMVHGSIAELLFATAWIIVMGIAGERYFGALNTAVILVVGCLVGALSTAVLSTTDVFLGAFAGGFALMGAGIYLYARRRSQMAIPHQQMSYILNYPGSALFLLVFMMAGNLPLPALAYAVFPAAGLVAGVVMAHLLLCTPDRITISSSPFRLALATLLVGALTAGVVTNLRGIGDAERLQAERVHWVQYAAFELPKSEREEFLQALVTKTEYLSRTGERAELVAEAARELDASAGMIVRALYSGLDTLCVGEDEDLQIWHNAMTDVLPAAEQRRYVTQIEDVCAPAI